MKIVGVLSMSNGSGLDYPYPPVVLSLAGLCDQVLVGVDPAYSLDEQTIATMGLANVEVVHAPWDRSNRSAGSEIALQMERLVDRAGAAGADWVVVLQADEVLHEDDFPMLRSFMERHLSTKTTGFSLERLYFWRDLQNVRRDWGAKLVRIFKPGTWSFLAEGTDKAGMFTGPVGAKAPALELPYKIYHYSRVDEDPSKISRRVRNLDAFFHAEETLLSEEALPDYDFVPRQYDNYAASGPPPVVLGEFSVYTGTHPLGVKEWYAR